MALKINLNAPSSIRTPSLIFCFCAPRSGLNLLLRCLNIMGFETADSVLGTEGPALIHEALRNELGIPLRLCGALPKGWQDTPAAQNAIDRLRRMLAALKENKKSWVVGDPWLARFYPLWQRALSESGLEPRWVHLLRHPWEAACSLAAREGLDLNKGHLLWLAHTRDALRAVRDTAHAQLTFDQLLTDPVHALEMILYQDRPANPESLFPDACIGSLKACVRPEFKHHHAGSITETEKQRWGFFIRRYDALRTLPEAHIRSAAGSHFTDSGERDAFVEEGFFDTLCEVLGRYEMAYPGAGALANRSAHMPAKPCELFVTAELPVENERYTKQVFRVYADQWQKLTLSLPHPDSLKRLPLRLEFLKTLGVVVLSGVRYVDPQTETPLFPVPDDPFGFEMTLQGRIVEIPSRGSRAFFIFGPPAQILCHDERPLPDHPLQAELWIKPCLNLEGYQETLSALLSYDNWKTILDADPSKADPASLGKLADVFAKARCMDAAETVYKKAIKRFSDAAVLRMGFAELAGNRRSWAEAIRRWQDVVALLGQNTPAEVYEKLKEAYINQNAFPEGSLEEEARIGDQERYEVLSLIHQRLAPSLYFEIGVQQGKSLSLAQCEAIGIDPMPQQSFFLSENAKILTMTSDDFFKGPAAKLLVRPPDLVLIDGMHFFEYALRDFMNVEKFSAPWTLVAIDDIFPAHSAQAVRRRKLSTWTGDVWKLYEILKIYRKDLFFLPLNASPTGLLLIAGLKPESRVLCEKYDEIVSHYLADMPPPEPVLKREGVWPTTHETVLAVLEVLRENRKPGVRAEWIVDRLTEKLRQGGGNSKTSPTGISYENDEV